MPPRSVTARAPVRACDAGGWTDTWFAGRGAVCALAMGAATGPLEGAAVEVTIDVVDGPAGVDLDVTSFGERYAYGPGAAPGRHPLLERTLARFGPADAALAVRVTSAVPPGCSLGTSAAVTVALVGALAALDGDGDGAAGALDPLAAAGRAHEVETQELGLQSGVQDQVAAAVGGAVRIDVDYPHATAARLAVPAGPWDLLADRLVTVYLGRPHHSSELHERVIASLGTDGGRARLDPLRRAAAAATDALTAGDLAGWAAALTAATEGQRALHPALVSDGADAVWAVGRGCGALGWKVNGAGGPGGSVTVVAGEGGGDALRAALVAASWTVLDLRPVQAGLTVVAR